MSGWIKLHREINSHWVWSNSDYFKWWVDLLLEANHCSSKVLIKGKVYECQRGQKLYSLETWAKRWGTNKSKVRRFLELLQKDKMIEYKNETQTTRITICKYDSYQGNENESETQTKRKRNESETQTNSIKELNNINNENNEEINNTASPFSFFNSLIDYGFEKKLISDWIKVRKTKKATNTETSFNSFIKEIEKRNCNINEILEFIIIKNWSGFKWSWYDTEIEKEKNSAKKDPIVSGRQTAATIQQNLDTTGLYVPSQQNKY